MDLFLKILGYLFLVLVLVVIIGFFLVRRWFAKVKEMSAMFGPVNLVVDPAPDWIQKPKVLALTAEFAAVGFKPHRVYQQTNMKIRPMIFANEARDQFGELYDTAAGLMCGFCADTEAGMSLNVTNSKMADVFAIKPRKIIEGYPDADIATLHAKFRQLVGGQRLKVIEDERFDEELQSQMNRDIEQNFEVGGIPLWQDDEPDFLARWGKHHYDEKDLRSAYESLCGESLAKISELVSDQLSDAEDLSAAVYSRYENNFIVFNPRLHKGGFCAFLVERFSGEEGVDPERITRLAAESADTRDFFERFIAEHPGLKLRKFYSVSAPIEADLWGYECPEEDDEG